MTNDDDDVDDIDDVKILNWILSLCWLIYDLEIIIDCKKKGSSGSNQKLYYIKRLRQKKLKNLYLNKIEIIQRRWFTFWSV